MKRLGSLLVIVLAALFATATVAGPGGAAAMTVKMSLAAGQGSDGGCTQCPDTDAKTTPCAGICAAFALATMPEGRFAISLRVNRHALAAVLPLNGGSCSLEPEPPRPLVLI